METNRPSARRVVVIGGSMAGLLAGLQLRARGFAVDIYERAEGELASRGAGIVAQPALIRALHRLGISTADLGVEVTTRRVLDVSGRAIVESRCSQTLTAWERLYRLLRDSFPTEHYHRNKSLMCFEQTGIIAATFSDGTSAEADLLIAADGIRSTVRQQLMPELQPLYAGYVAWRAMLSERAIPLEMHDDLFGGMTFCLPPGEQFLCYPVAGPDNDLRPGHRRLNVIWYRPADEASELRRLLTDESGVAHPVSIPPPLIRKEAINAMHAAAQRLLAPQLRTIAGMMEQPALQPIYDLEAPRMVFGRAILIGDAAFVARPHVGAGVSKASDDASALADAVVNEDLKPALIRFETTRLQTGRRIVERARQLGACLQAMQTTAERDHASRHSTARAVIEQTALVDFLER